MGFFNSGNSPVYLYDPTSSDIIKLNDQATPPIPEPGRLIIFSKIIEGKQKIFSIDANGEEKELGVDALKIIENHFLMGGANGQPENKSVNEIKTILGIEQIESDVSSLSSQFSASDMSAVSGSLENKVDKVKDASGNEIKHLSTNDFSDEEKQKIEQNRLDILDKVDKKAGYQLTQEDFTSVLRALLVNIGDVAANSIKIGDENGIGNNITFNQFKEDFGINSKVDKILDNDGNEIKQLSTNDFTDIYKNHIDNLLAIVNTNNEDLDTFSEIIAYIQSNKNELDALSISSIIGLEDALNSKFSSSGGHIDGSITISYGQYFGSNTTPNKRIIGAAWLGGMDCTTISVPGGHNNGEEHILTITKDKRVSVNSTVATQGNFTVNTLGQTGKTHGIGLNSGDVWTHIYNSPGNNYGNIDVTYGGWNNTTGSNPYHLILNPTGGKIGVKNINLNYQLSVEGTVAGYSFTSTSDERAKEDIKDIDISIVDKLSKIQIKSFKFKKDDKKFLNYGVIAQQLQKIGLDDLVQKSNQIEYFKNIEDAKDFVENNKEYSAKIEDFISKEENKKDLKYKVSFFKLGVNYNNLFILQQALINDQQSVLRTQGLSFLIDDIKDVYNNEYNNTYEVLTIQGDLIKSIEKNGNTQQQRIDVWVSNGGKVKTKAYNNDEARAIIKEKAEELIVEKYSRDEQRNIDRECLHLKAVEGIDPKRLSEEEKQKLQIHKDMGAYIESILQKCAKLKSDSEKLRNGKLQTLVKSVMDGSAYEVMS